MAGAEPALAAGGGRRESPGRGPGASRGETVEEAYGRDVVERVRERCGPGRDLVAGFPDFERYGRDRSVGLALFEDGFLDLGLTGPDLGRYPPAELARMAARERGPQPAKRGRPRAAGGGEARRGPEGARGTEGGREARRPRAEGGPPRRPRIG